MKLGDKKQAFSRCCCNCSNDGGPCDGVDCTTFYYDVRSEAIMWDDPLTQMARGSISVILAIIAFLLLLGTGPVGWAILAGIVAGILGWLAFYGISKFTAFTAEERGCLNCIMGCMGGNASVLDDLGVEVLAGIVSGLIPWLLLSMIWGGWWGAFGRSNPWEDIVGSIVPLPVLPNVP